jgi:hypothetical protein
MATTANQRQATTDNAVKRGLNWLQFDRAIGAAGAMRSRLIAERLARKTQDGTLGQQTEMHEDEELKNMQLNVGDTYNITDSPAPATTSEPSQGSSNIWPYVLAAALAGGGLGVGGYALMDKDKPVDTDTQYEIRLSTDEQANVQLP